MMLRIIAHRGSSKLYPENSLAAFEHALKAGADGLEVDLRRSADDRLYCFHDQNLFRLTGYTGRLRRTDSSVIRRLKLMRREPILNFEHFLESFGGKTRIVLDIKSAGVEDQIVELISGLGIRHDITYSSFQKRILQRVKALDPKARTALIVGPIRNLPLKLDLGRFLVGCLRGLQCDAIHISRHLAREAIVRKVRKAGFEVVVWTVDDLVLAKQHLKQGVHSIITNVPEAMVTMRDI